MISEEQQQLYLHWDTKQVFLNDEPFTPMIQGFENWEKNPSGNTVVIELDAGLKSSLNWDSSVEQASEAQKNNQYIIWRFNLGLESSRFSLSDSVIFETFKKTLQYFVSRCAEEFSQSTLGVIFYQGSSDFSKVFKSCHATASSFQKWMAESNVGPNGGIEEQQYRHFYADYFLSYLQMLSCEIPDSWTIFLPLDLLESNSVAELFDYYSKERFEHFLLCLRGGDFPYSAICWQEGRSCLGSYDFSSSKHGMEASLGLLFPSSASSSGLYLQMDALISTLRKNGIPFRILYEKFAVEDWNELDYVLVSSPCSEFIQRMLLGFCAAGGTAVVDGPSIGLSYEMCFKEFLENNRGRGI